MADVTSTLDTRKWCWATSDISEEWFGPFDTREAAIADAESAGPCIDEKSFSISRCNYAVPADAAMAWAKTMEPMESMHDHTDEELQDYDGGETYDYIDGDGTKAIEELNGLIADWAARNVKARWFCCDGAATETVERK